MEDGNLHIPTRALRLISEASITYDRNSLAKEVFLLRAYHPSWWNLILLEVDSAAFRTMITSLMALSLFTPPKNNNSPWKEAASQKELSLPTTHFRGANMLVF